MDYVAEHLEDPLPALFAGCDRAIRHTRGVAMGVAVIDKEAGTLTYAGVGNTRALITGASWAVATGDYRPKPAR